MDNEDQLAAVLAHETIHCIQRHALRALRNYRDQPALLTAVQHTLLNTPSLQEMARFMGITGAIAAINGYARELEAEADRMGIELMARAGYNPKEALALFDHMMDEIEQEGLAEPFFFGSHPAFKQRAGDLQSLPDFAYSLTEPTARNNNIFLARLGRIFLDNAGMDIRLGRFHSAGHGIEKLLRINPAEPRAYYLLGEIYRQRGQDGDTSRALKNYNHAISLDPEYAAAHKAVGLIHYKKGHRALAKKFFESCLQLSPNRSDKTYIQDYIKQCERKKEG
jgi:predicted Zn-dependent protease